METIPGSGNWRLTIRRETAGITLLRAATCDKRAVLPETLYGLPVTALWDHALSPTAAPAEGEDLLVTCGTLAEQIGTGALQIRPDLTWIHTENLEELKQWLADGIHAGDCVLFKGSNSMKLVEAADDVCQRHH